jgi:hypothetical protein
LIDVYEDYNCFGEVSCFAVSKAEFVELIDDDRCVLKGIVTGEESLYFFYGPETKRQNAAG